MFGVVVWWEGCGDGVDCIYQTPHVLYVMVIYRCIYMYMYDDVICASMMS